MTVKRWDVSSGQCTLTLEGHTASVRGMSIHHYQYQMQLFTVSDDGSAKCWNCLTGKCLNTFKFKGAATCVCVDRNGGRLFVGVDKSILCVDIGSGKPVYSLEGHSEVIYSLCLEATESRLVSGSWDKTIKLWDLGRMKCADTLEGHQEGVSGVCMAGQNAFICSSSGDGTVKVWELATGDCLFTSVGHVGEVTGVCSTSTMFFSCGVDKTVRQGSGQKPALFPWWNTGVPPS